MELQIRESIENSVAYLNSDSALKTVAADSYWPKWNSPWWHMLLLHEMGEGKSIPSTMIDAYIESLNRIALKIFPIHPSDMPEGVDPYRGSPCHCQLGNVYQVLAKWGVDVDKELPWIRPWFLQYQMADGGMNCDSDAYLVKDEVPSSMVGFIAAFEAILLYTPREWTQGERLFLQKGADFLIKRKVMLGSITKHNARERESALQWTKLCFPRFYLYDVLRGLNALLLWSVKTGEQVPKESIVDVVTLLKDQFADGNVRIGRRSFEGAGTILQDESGDWMRSPQAFSFPLLQRVSVVGEVSPFLTRQWSECKTMISRDSRISDLL